MCTVSDELPVSLRRFEKRTDDMGSSANTAPGGQIRDLTGPHCHYRSRDNVAAQLPTSSGDPRLWNPKISMYSPEVSHTPPATNDCSVPNPPPVAFCELAHAVPPLDFT